MQTECSALLLDTFGDMFGEEPNKHIADAIDIPQYEPITRRPITELLLGTLLILMAIGTNTLLLHSSNMCASLSRHMPGVHAACRFAHLQQHVLYCRIGPFF